MKKVSMIVAGICLISALNLRAADEKTEEKPAAKPQRHLTDEQKSLMSEIKTKYDTNKDGKLDKEERAKMTDADKERLKKAGLGRQGKGTKKKSSDASAASTTPSPSK